jgi:hypothetical protein
VIEPGSRKLVGITSRAQVLAMYERTIANTADEFHHSV